MRRRSHSPVSYHASRPARDGRAWRRFAYLACWLCLAPPATGCGGCRPGANDDDGLSDEERLAKREELLKKKKPKRDFEFLQFTTQPGTLGEKDKKEIYLKLGHWTSAVFDLRTNNFDFQGELATEMVDSRSQPVDLDQMPFRLRTIRPALMSKGQKKYLEFSLFAPVDAPTRAAATRILARGGREIVAESQPVRPMPAHQYYFVVLSGSPNDYGFLKLKNSIRAPAPEMLDPLTEAHYRVVWPRIRSVAPLPSGALGWTGIAYVLWDDLAPGKLSPAQQQALVDWLHWGGQMIVSGPHSLDTLQGSFLDPYLPATGGETWPLSAETLQPLNEQWLVGGRPLKPVRDWTGQKLKPRPESQVLARSGEEPLLVERRVGRGRVIVSAFRLAQRELRNWPSFDNFLNGALMRRGPREFHSGTDDQARFRWLDGKYSSHDPRLVSRLRYFTRDAHASPVLFGEKLRGRKERAVLRSGDEETFGSESGTPPPGHGVAGWDDFSMASDLAFTTLREAAGIEVPSAMFVVWTLTIYVVVLVPLNWLVFRLLGRVELAWAAAPFIAVGAAAAVAWLAQLDIGFARSMTELAVVELQPGYPRGHVTRYTALYSSLGTSYDLRFDDATAVALPFATGKDLGVGDRRTNVDFRRARKAGSEKDGLADSLVTLEGLAISSNTTGMVHSEQMLALAGGVRCERLAEDRYQLTNETGLALEAAGVVGAAKACWIGTLVPGASTTVELRPRPEKPEDLFAAELVGASVGAGLESRGGFNIHHLLRLAQQEGLRRELRLVAFTREDMPGLTIVPSAAQARQLTLVVAHLDFGPEPAPANDANLAPDPRKIDPSNGPAEAE
ncbi:MAG TPA: hypothetical protein VMV69_27430 [Pirellulales bacterium]|nr:hypothetical protein [Pirellulales bacterium]